MTPAPILCLPDSKAGFRVTAIRKLNPQLLPIGAFRSLSQAKEAEAFAAEAAGDATNAVANLKEAVAIEDSIDDLSQPPYPVIPANELCV
jgi:hypothetical protein